MIFIYFITYIVRRMLCWEPLVLSEANRCLYYTRFFKALLIFGIHVLIRHPLRRVYFVSCIGADEYRLSRRIFCVSCSTQTALKGLYVHGNTCWPATIVVIEAALLSPSKKDQLLSFHALPFSMQFVIGDFFEFFRVSVFLKSVLWFKTNLDCCQIIGHRLIINSVAGARSFILW